MKLLIKNNQLIIKKFLSTVTLNPGDIELIDCSEVDTKIKLRNGKVYTVSRLKVIFFETDLMKFAYKNRIGFISLDFNDMNTLYLESELQDRLMDQLERIRVLALPHLRQKYGLDYDLLMVPYNEDGLVSVTLGAVKQGTAVRFNTPYSSDGSLGDFYIFLLARITPINGEVLYALSTSFETDKELEEELKDIIDESELELN